MTIPRNSEIILSKLTLSVLISIKITPPSLLLLRRPSSPWHSLSHDPTLIRFPFLVARTSLLRGNIGDIAWDNLGLTKFEAKSLIWGLGLAGFQISHEKHIFSNYVWWTFHWCTLHDIKKMAWIPSHMCKLNTLAFIDVIFWMYPYDILGFFPLCGKNPFDLMWLIGDLLICMIWGKCNLLLFKCMWFDKVNHVLSLHLILHVNFSLNFGCCHTSFQMEKASFYECLVLLVQYVPRALAFKTILQNACEGPLSFVGQPRKNHLLSTKETEGPSASLDQPSMIGLLWKSNRESLSRLCFANGTLSVDWQWTSVN